MPPTLKGEDAEKTLRSIVFDKEIGGHDFTYGATVELHVVDKGNGLDAPKLPEDISTKLTSAAQDVFGTDPLYVGGGGSIPFMEVFAEIFPEANFLLTGCCFNDSNAHSANENLDLEYCRKLTTVISKLLSTL